MLLYITAKEFRENLLSTRFAIMLGVILALVSAVIFVLSAEHRKQVNDYHRRVALHRQKAGADSAYNLATVDRPIPILSSLFRGLVPLAPDQMELTDSQPPAPKQAAEIEAT